MALFDRLRPRRAFRLPPFEPAPLEFEASSELLLDEVARHIQADSTVVRLVHPIATAGELHASIEEHLGRAQASPPADAAEELKNALADLRRSLG